MSPKSDGSSVKCRFTNETPQEVGSWQRLSPYSRFSPANSKGRSAAEDRMHFPKPFRITGFERLPAEPALAVAHDGGGSSGVMDVALLYSA